MTPDILLRCVVAPALSLLPPALDRREARVMLLTIAMQETALRHRRQVRGPARGWWQFERGGLNGVLRHRASREHMVDAVEALAYPEAAPEALHEALEHNDLLACCAARLLLYTLPQPLPATRVDGWRQYIDAWRPGKPHPETWPKHWEIAMEACHA